jgi:hypothetical protein
MTFENALNEEKKNKRNKASPYKFGFNIHDPTYYNQSFDNGNESVRDYRRAISKKGAYYTVWHHQYITKTTV